jgi:hypothetical protein
VTSTFVGMTNALQDGEKVHIIAYDSTEYADIVAELTNASVPLSNIDFFIYPTDDVWSRDNGPMFVYDQNNELTILDWGFNGWGLDTPYSLCDVIPESVGGEATKIDTFYFGHSYSGNGAIVKNNLDSYRALIFSKILIKNKKLLIDRKNIISYYRNDNLYNILEDNDNLYIHGYKGGGRNVLTIKK